ncbi:MAG: hypothetical protein SAK29_02450 [Scytonema sp. PMC 1069.18]|nr:hypothetical protein [Scytonema sp. PMC 1069.18]MEC4879897.1 hypothetical protein [Scytonema sp. PMC 1070.18]
MKPPVYYRAALVTFSLGILVLPMGCQKLSVSFDTTNLDQSSPSTQTTQSQSQTLPSISTLTSSDPPPPNQVENSSRKAKNTTNTLASNSGQKAPSSSNLRMSNQTDQPVRLALLSRHSLEKSSKTGEINNAVPAHWDFAPQEGSEKGLVLSLPDRNLSLQKGDILVAFAQDGSRNYWGPYVVGETSSPRWNPQKQEWELILTP